MRAGGLTRGEGDSGVLSLPSQEDPVGKAAVSRKRDLGRN